MWVRNSVDLDELYDPRAYGERSECVTERDNETRQALGHPTMGKENRKSSMLKREGSTHGEGGLYKKLKIPALPPKSLRSGVTFH